MFIIRFVDALIRQTDNPAWLEAKEDLSGVLDLGLVLELFRGQTVAVFLGQGQPRLGNLSWISQVTSVLCSSVKFQQFSWRT